MATWGWLTCALLFGLIVGWFGCKTTLFFKNKGNKN